MRSRDVYGESTIIVTSSFKILAEGDTQTDFFFGRTLRNDSSVLSKYKPKKNNPDNLHGPLSQNHKPTTSSLTTFELV